ncbi:hypothetical protein JW823_08385 [bacterium]|nr:hypothetical protein [candidate division CSSED10-310 bacterium]
MKKTTIGIRREDKNIWEKRVPLVPADVKRLVEEDGFRVVVQPALNHRAFPDAEYIHAGAEINEDLADADIILGVKEIPISKFISGKTYIFFSHVIKGQTYNMPMLKRIIANACTLIDYEKIEDQYGKRLIFFGRYAGIAGMVETLSAYGKRSTAEGIVNPFSRIDQPYRYGSLEECLNVVRDTASDIIRNGLPHNISPFIVGITGYGNVSKGAQEVLDLLPVTSIDANQLRKGISGLPKSSYGVYKVIFEEKDMFRHKDDSVPFSLQDYFRNPQNYISKFNEIAPLLSVMVNCIYWTDACPRLLTKGDIIQMYRSNNPRLKVIGDISCDIEGSIEATSKATELNDPCFVYDIDLDDIVSGVIGNGPAIMAIENLPCEIPLESSSGFSSALKVLLPGMKDADFSRDIDRIGLPDEIKGAVIVLNGVLTDKYRYLEKSLN